MAVEHNSTSVELDWLQAREIAIQEAIDSGNLAGLRAWSKEVGGFGSSAVRQKAWYVWTQSLSSVTYIDSYAYHFRPFLLGVKRLNSMPREDSLADSNGRQEETFQDTVRSSTEDSVVDVAALIEEDRADEGEVDINVQFDSQDQQQAQNLAEHHPDERQVHLDTQRSFVYYPPDLHASEKKRLQEELHEVIVTVLRKRKGLSYFQVSANQEYTGAVHCHRSHMMFLQGYHDIISVLYLTFLPYTPPQRSRSTSRSSSQNRPTARERHASRSRSRGASKSPLSRPPGEEKSRIGRSKGSGPSENEQHSARSQSKDSPEWQVLLDCCDAVSLLRIRDGMTKGLAPVIGYLRSVGRAGLSKDP
ncbi:hypothetical protein QFC19_004748 [Naganishia cerealis]|uniref:Uncharacterized protein n=1 Tax=Naganishia cerealis TaxID=610337 RepID=A0ACC2VT93_9TREE|nr:hypothetical protein QFC19_004748 [Naganishia cerealis]